MTDFEIRSIPVPDELERVGLHWERVPGARAYIVCRSRVELGPDNAPALLSGGLDLMLERWVLPETVTSVCEHRTAELPHRLVLARIGSGLVPLDIEMGPPAETEPELDTFGPPATGWDAAPTAGTPREHVEEGPRTYGTRRSTSSLDEPDQPGLAGPRRLGFVERSLSIRHGPAHQRERPLPTPGEAFEGIRPRAGAGARLPDLGSMATPDPGDAPGGPPTWAVIADPELLNDAHSAARAMRTLRGWYKVAVAGSRDRGLLVRRAERVGVPIDQVVALESDNPRLAAALSCHPSQMLVFVIGDGAAPAEAIRIEVDLHSFAQEAARCCQG